MKHIRKVTAYHVGNKLHRTRKTAEHNAGHKYIGVNVNSFLYY